MITQMLRKVVIEDGNDNELAKGTQISKRKITEINGDILLDGGIPAKFKPILLGVSKSSVETDSWLSAASFQETTKVLTDAAVNGKIDVLRGLKENVIIGKKIPAGTGTDAVRESTIEIKRRAEEERRIKAERIAQESEEEARLQSLVAAEGDAADTEAASAE